MELFCGNKEQDDEEIEIVPKKKKAAGSVNGKEENGHSNGSSYMTNPAIGKCPEVDTSFLPDRVREQRVCIVRGLISTSIIIIEG